MTLDLVLTGALAGLALGFVFQRADLCFHSTWRGLLEGRFHLAKVWLLGVAIASVGLSLVYASDQWRLNEGLGLRPQGNILGGLIVGVGMVVTVSCVSGLFYKFGSGMAGASVGLATWALGDVVGNRFLIGRDGALDLRGDAVRLDNGPTIPDVLAVDRMIVSVVFLLVVVALVSRSRRDTATGVQWSWAFAGVTLGLATTVAWILAGVGGATFGPSSVGAPASVFNGGSVNQWLVSFVVFTSVGATIAAVRSSTFRVRGETGPRYVGLAAGGLLLGVGGQIGGGCNLGHGLSGAAQLNVSSWLVVASIIVGIALARAVQVRLSTSSTVAPSDWRVTVS